MYQNFSGIRSQSFVQFPSYANEFKMSSLVPHHPFYFLSTELVQTNWRASSVPTTHEFLDSDIMPRDLRAWREQRKQKQLEGEQVLYLMNQDMVASTEGGIQMNLKIRPNRNICIQYTILWNQRYCFHDNIIILMMLQNLLVSKLAIALIRIRITSQFPFGLFRDSSTPMGEWYVRMLEGYCFNTLNSIPLTLKLGIEIESSSPGFVLRQDFFFRGYGF